MQVVFDASTLILLAKIDLLREIAEAVKVIIPRKVRAESLAKEGMDALLISTLIKEKKIDVKEAGSTEAIKKLQMDFRIEGGEAEALWLARRLTCPIAVDDGPTIKACKVINQSSTTALHFLLNLVAQNRLERPIAVTKLEKLSKYGRYNREIIENARMRLKGENR
jgi:hypothetical protein